MTMISPGVKGDLNCDAFIFDILEDKSSVRALLVQTIFFSLLLVGFRENRSCAIHILKDTKYGYDYERHGVAPLLERGTRDPMDFMTGVPTPRQEHKKHL